jgi:hypothetical protein
MSNKHQQEGDETQGQKNTYHKFDTNVFNTMGAMTKPISSRFHNVCRLPVGCLGQRGVSSISLVTYCD